MSDPNSDVATEAKLAFKAICSKKKRVKAFLLAKQEYLG